MFPWITNGVSINIGDTPYQTVSSNTMLAAQIVGLESSNRRYEEMKTTWPGSNFEQTGPQFPAVRPAFEQWVMGATAGPYPERRGTASTAGPALARRGTASTAGPALERRATAATATTATTAGAVLEQKGAGLDLNKAMDSLFTDPVQLRRVRDMCERSTPKALGVFEKMVNRLLDIRKSVNGSDTCDALTHELYALVMHEGLGKYSGFAGDRSGNLHDEVVKLGKRIAKAREGHSRSKSFWKWR